MTRITNDSGLKATTTTTATETADDPYAAAKAELKAKLEAAIEELEAVDDEYLSDEYYHEKERLVATLKAESALVDTMGMNGSSSADGTQGWDTQELADAGWNYATMTESEADRMAIENNSNGDWGTYAGTVEIPNSGNPDLPNAVGFQMTDDMTAVYAESRGRDIVMTVEYKDGHRESYLIKEGSVRPEPIIISAKGLTDGVTIDCSKVFRVNANDGRYPASAYELQVMSIIGGDGDDKLLGSQSKDIIVGNAGDDTMDGGAGDDVIFGDLGYNIGTGDDAYIPGAYDASVEGNDTIRGGAGADRIYGGAGLDTTYASDKGEAVHETEGKPLKDANTSSLEPEDIFDMTEMDGWEATVDDDGTILLQNEGTTGGGVIDMSMPDGYTMAFAEQDADGTLIITFVGTDEDGNPCTCKVKIEDFFNITAGGADPASVVRLNFHGGEGDDIIDFSKVSVTNQVINITDEAGGSDIILGARSALLSDGVDLDKLTQSQGNSANRLNRYVEDGIFSDYSESDDKHVSNGYRADVSDGQIVITSDGENAQADTLSLDAPDGYDKGYITTDGNSLYVVLVKQNASGTAETIVIKIDASLLEQNGGKLNWNDIYVGAIDLVPISNTEINMDDYAVSAGEGEDLVFAQSGSRVDDDEDEVMEMSYAVRSTTKTTSTTETEDAGETGETEEAGETGETEEAGETDETEDAGDEEEGE